MKHVKLYENLKSLDITEGWNFAFSLLVRSYVRFKSNFKRTLVPYFFVIIALQPDHAYADPAAVQCLVLFCNPKSVFIF